MSDLEIIKKCKSRDPEGFKVLVRRFSSGMMGIGVRYLKTRDGAQDAMQEAFIRIFKSIENIREDGNLEGWVKKIMVNECLKTLKNKINFEDLEDFNQINPFISQRTLDHDLHVEDILSRLNQLPDHYRIIFNLYEVEGYVHKEISEMLGITESTSRTKLMRAKEKLKFFFQQNESETYKKIKMTYE